MQNHPKINALKRLKCGLFLLFFLGVQLVALSQEVDSQITVTGLVLDEKGIPLMGATVMEEGTSNGVVTDFDGNFQIEASPEAQISISFIGFKTKTIAATTGFVEVSLEPDAAALDEVVVIGYGQSKQRDLTG
ncbi:MAG: carboxypeptidase-like regulatory domain-containing protein, partial [Flavobacteriaceae bacterium]|nr:carboxypeptidase-like regulatory domain-containing protein [Flavobacteriaceae bacterium]